MCPFVPIIEFFLVILWPARWVDSAIDEAHTVGEGTSFSTGGSGIPIPVHPVLMNIFQSEIAVIIHYRCVSMYVSLTSTRTF